MAPRLMLLLLLGACVTRVPGHVTIVREPEQTLAYDYHEATLRQADDGFWWVTLIRYDRSGGPNISTYDNERVETIEIPLGPAPAEGARLELNTQQRLAFWHEPMPRGTAQRFAKGEVVVESWDENRGHVTGQFTATRGKMKLSGRFDAFGGPRES